MLSCFVCWELYVVQWGWSRGQDGGDEGRELVGNQISKVLEILGFFFNEGFEQRSIMV